MSLPPPLAASLPTGHVMPRRSMGDWASGERARDSNTSLIRKTRSFLPLRLSRSKQKTQREQKTPHLFQSLPRRLLHHTSPSNFLFDDAFERSTSSPPPPPPSTRVFWLSFSSTSHQIKKKKKKKGLIAPTSTFFSSSCLH